MLNKQTKEVASILRAGGVAVFPTDTAYGLGCLYNNAAAIERILLLKGRTDRKFTIIAASLEQVEAHFPLSPAQRALAQKYWPGPLSIVVSDQFSIRVPNQPVAQDLAAAAGAPLIATSANRTGSPSPFTISQAKAELGETNVDTWLDAGELSEQPPSTVVQVANDGTLTVIRQGATHLDA